MDYTMLKLNFYDLDYYLNDTFPPTKASQGFYCLYSSFYLDYSAFLVDVCVLGLKGAGKEHFYMFQAFFFLRLFALKRQEPKCLIY